MPNFICVLALQLERWMRNRLQTMSVARALQSLQQIKVGELTVNGKRKTMTTRITTEQKEILNRLGIKQMPAQFSAGKVVV